MAFGGALSRARRVPKRLLSLALVVAALGLFLLMPGDVVAQAPPPVYTPPLGDEPLAGLPNPLVQTSPPYYPGRLPQNIWENGGGKTTFYNDPILGSATVKGDETCASEGIHSGHIGPSSGGKHWFKHAHEMVELLNVDYPLHDPDRPVKRLDNGGVVVQPIFNCLPNFWGWILYKKDPLSPQLVTVDDHEKPERPVEGVWDYEWKWVGDGGGIKYALPFPNVGRGRTGNTRSGDVAIRLFNDAFEGAPEVPNLHPSGNVFRYQTHWSNGRSIGDGIQAALTLGGAVSEGASVTHEDEIFVKIWTASAIIDYGSTASGEYVTPAGESGTIQYVDLKVWPNVDDRDPGYPNGIAVGEYTTVSVWRQIIGGLHPVVWANRAIGNVARGGVSLVCTAWESAANVTGNGCEGRSDPSKKSAGGSEYFLSVGALNGDQPMHPMVDNTGEPSKGARNWRSPAPDWIDDDRAIFIRRDLQLAESDMDAFVSSFGTLDYNVRVGGPARAPSAQTPPWPSGAPVMRVVEVSPPAGWTSFVEGEKVYIRVKFNEEVYFSPWVVDGSGLSAADQEKYEAAAEFQTLENLRLRLAGLYCAQTPVRSSMTRSQARELLSARYDVDSSATTERGTTTWQFVYTIPENCFTVRKVNTTDRQTFFGVASHNDLSAEDLDWGGGNCSPLTAVSPLCATLTATLPTLNQPTLITGTAVDQCFGPTGYGSCGKTQDVYYETTPFWFHFDGAEDPANASFNQYFRVGASFRGADGQYFDPASPAQIPPDLTYQVRQDFDIPDLRLKTGKIFLDSNTVSHVDSSTIADWRRTNRSILTFSGLIKGTPSSATYELGYVVYGWAIMMNLVFALFVIFIAWAGLSSVVKPLLGGNPNSATWKDMVPRILLAAIAVASSFWWCRLLIDLADAVSRYVAGALHVNPGDIIPVGMQLLNSEGISATEGSVYSVLVSDSNLEYSVLVMAVLAVLLLYLIMTILVLGQLILRIVMINILLIISPIALSMWILPETEGWAKRWLSMWMITLFRHALQLVGLGLALAFIRMVVPYEGEQMEMGQLFWGLVLALFALYITWKIPSMIGDGGVSEGYLNTLFMVTNMVANAPAALRTAAQVAGIAGTGGIANMAAGPAGRGMSTMGQNAGSAVVNSSGAMLRSMRGWF